jgi:hypothetical protein
MNKLKPRVKFFISHRGNIDGVFKEITEIAKENEPINVIPFDFKYGNSYNNDLDEIKCDWFKKISYRQLITLIENAASDEINPNTNTPNTVKKGGGKIRHTVRQELKTRRVAKRIHHQRRDLTKMDTNHIVIPQKRRIRETQNNRVYMTRGGGGNMSGISEAMDVIFQQCNCWMVKRMANQLEEKAKDPNMIEPITRFLLSMNNCMYNGVNVLFCTLGLLIANELIPGLAEARRTLTTFLAYQPIIRQGVELALTVPTAQLASSLIICAKLMYLTQNRLKGANPNADKNMLDLEISLLASPFIPFMKTVYNNNYEVVSTPELSLKELADQNNNKFNGFVPGWYYVYEPPAVISKGTSYIKDITVGYKQKEFVPTNVAYVESIVKTGQIYKLNMCYFVASQLVKLTKSLSGTNDTTNNTKDSDPPDKSLFKDEYFNENVIMQPMSYVLPPDICIESESPLKLISDSEVKNQFIWMNGMFLGYAESAKIAKMKIVGVDEYSFDFLCTDKRCKTNTEGTYNTWFLKRFTLESKSDISRMFESGKGSSYYFTAKSAEDVLKLDSFLRSSRAV